MAASKSLLRGFALLCACCAASCLTACSAASDMPSASAPAAPRCAVPDGVSRSPRSIAEALALANALPRPASVSCFVEALERPLTLAASESRLSLQPSSGPSDPRVFIFYPPLYLTVVSAGPARDAIEFGELHDGFRSVKAEIRFPITKSVPPEEPFQHILDETGKRTLCAACHANEMPFDAALGSYISTAYQPKEGVDVSPRELARQAQACDEQGTPERCAILHALTDAPVIEHHFPADMPRFSN